MTPCTAPSSRIFTIRGVYLVSAKYRYLRAAYAMFLLGFIAAGLALAVTAAAR